MKKYLLILFTVGLFTGCDKYDDGKLWDNINNLEARLTALEKQCKEMNTNIESMKVIVDVLQSNDYVTNVTVVSENGVEIGYKIDFHVHPSITIYHGEKGEDGKDGQTPYVGENGNWWIGEDDTRVKAAGEDGQAGETPKIGSNGNWWIGSSDTGIKAQGENGKDGEAGKDGVTPVIGVKQDVDGVYYWTQKVGDSESTWILDSEGKKIKTTEEKGDSGQTPYIGSNGNWWIGTSDTGVNARGEDGQNGITPVIGSNGNWWIGSQDTGVKAQGENGNDGITPQLKIENDNWMLSVDNGQTWQNLGKAKGDKGDSGDSFFKSVVNGEKDLTLELEDGTVIKLPKQQVFSITLDKTRFSDVLPSTSYEVNYTIAGEESQRSNVEIIAPADWKTVVQRTNDRSGKIVVTTPSFVTDSKVLVLVSDENGGNTLMKTVTFLKGKISVEKTSYTVESGGEVIDVKVETSIDYEVSVATGDQSWITCETYPLDKGRFTLTIQPNRDPVFRYATVELVNNDGFVLEKISITQKSAVVKEIHVETAGTLETLVTTEELNGYENVKITGRLNTFDYDYLKLAGNLKGVDLSDLDMNTIPASAFSGSSLQTVLLPKNLIVIPSRAFYQSKITSITIPETVIEIGEYAFYQCQQTRGDLVIPSNVESIGTYAFRDCTFDGVLTLSSLKLKEIKEYTFSGSKLTGKLVLPLNVEKIGDNAFANCSGFTGLTLNENLLSIGEDAFEKCSGFEGNLVIPDKVQTIGMSAFQECEGLQGNLTIGKSVTDLGAWVFTIRNIYNGDRTNFNKIYFKCLVPPSNLTNTFGRLSNSCKLKYVAVPIGCKDAYMRAFSNYIDVIEEIEF
ncbi:leucine-rich repeat protein [Butyricimonas virosa]|uniref:leucine-rich repeat protein n=1 Tax=Butyricimonas virosa TaxID=544645 RepID=UPI0022E7CB69|nr:leucine-rich repeat protein [Butyricimonas virosa]